MNTEIETLISAEDIAQKTQEFGKLITENFAGKKPVLVCVLKGSFVFYADLIRAIHTDVICEFLGVSSYHGGTQSSGEVKLTLDLTNTIEGKDVILVEDIVDTGITMNYLVNALQIRKPRSITTMALLYKPGAIKEKCKLDHYGFKIGNEFVVGYGLDYQGYYRNLPYIGILNSLN